MNKLTILQGDCRAVLKTLPDQSVQTCVTSPPYWGLRDYGCAGQLGLESTPEEYVSAIVDVFREVRRVLRDDGTLWIVIGDSYSGSGKGGNPDEGKQATNAGSQTIGTLYGKTGESARQAAVMNVSRRLCAEQGMPPKQLIGIPWRVAFALQADGWWLRQDLIWHKPSTMPESVTDRCTKAHEYIFLLSKSANYYFDNESIKEPSAYPDDDRKGRSYDHHKSAPTEERNGVRPGNYLDEGRSSYPMRNKRSVWSVTNAGFNGAHFATFPPLLILPCILAGCPKDGVVLDPFLGSGTSAIVALENCRDAIGIELNPEYAAMAQRRCDSITPMIFA